MKTPAEQADWPIQVIRSARRRRTVGARLENGVLIIRAPEAMTDEDLAPFIENLKKRVQRRSSRLPQSDQELERRAREFNRKYFDGELAWHSVRYVTNQNSRFGSCTPDDGTIRISHRLASMPAWVRDYVLVHELTHLIERNHGPSFWRIVNRYPLAERARGYLMAVGLEELDSSP